MAGTVARGLPNRVVVIKRSTSVSVPADHFSRALRQRGKPHSVRRDKNCSATVALSPHALDELRVLPPMLA